MQKFIILGHGYGDLFELEAIIENNYMRVNRGVFLVHHTTSSFCLIMNPVRGNFQAIYTIFNGIKFEGQKYELIQQWCKSKNIHTIDFHTKPPDTFYEKAQFFQYVTGLFRLNHILPPMQ